MKPSIFLLTACLRFATQIFADIAKLSSATVPKTDLEMRPVKSLNSQIIIRGLQHSTQGELDSCVNAAFSGLSRGYKFSGAGGGNGRHAGVAAADDNVQFTTSESPLLNSIEGCDSSITTLSLRSNVASYVRNVITSAQLMYSAGAYLQYYEREGLERDDWKEAFENSWRIVESYEDLFLL